MVVYRVSTNWRQKMQDDAEIGLAVLDFNRISDGLVCNDAFPFFPVSLFSFALGAWIVDRGVCGRFKMPTARN